MATLDDKLLGEKTQYYCSSSSGSEGEEEEEDSAGTGPADGPQGVGPNVSCQGPASNTGPKGVLADWRRYKQLEAEGREEARRERERLHRSLAFTCQSYGDERRDREHQLQERFAKKLTLKDDDDADADDDADDDDAAFLSEYRERRMAELRRRLSSGPRYGAVTELPGGEALLRAVDESPPRTPVLVHVYDGAVPACAALDGCLRCLAPRYPSARVCRVRAAAVAGLSAAFASRALPALLVYRGGELVGNFVRLSDQLGDDFFADDLEGFLGEHGLLPERDGDGDGAGDGAGGAGSDGSGRRRSVAGTAAAAAAAATAFGDDCVLDIV
ncbi:phosducin-like protein isoform X2 [Petromyzon marinus]|uniref:Phosducin-like protein isoform X2 n=1 Tax=Petromyzon marinus TaxID=7757 RepID=A0AAJ7U9N6_PETMA|nr:phosducin-like protein isoform X2 [Petromyzon marinus]